MSAFTGRSVQALVVCALFVLTGCTREPGAADTPGSSRATWEDAGVGVVATGCAGLASEVGSGVTIGEPGQVVTTAHTVAGATSVLVIDAAGTEFAASIVALDKNADLAILEAPGLETTPLELGESALGPATAAVWSRELGVHGVAVEVTKRLDITIEDIYVEDQVRRSGIELLGEISIGDSGGAIVGPDNRVVGIIYAKSRPRPQVAFATDHQEIGRLLSERPTDAFDRCN